MQFLKRYTFLTSQSAFFKFYNCRHFQTMCYSKFKQNSIFPKCILNLPCKQIIQKLLYYDAHSKSFLLPKNFSKMQFWKSAYFNFKIIQFSKSADVLSTSKTIVHQKKLSENVSIKRYCKNWFFFHLHCNFQKVHFWKMHWKIDFKGVRQKQWSRSNCTKTF